MPAETLSDLLEERRREHGGRPALVAASATLRWEDVAGRVHAAAGGLAGLGVQPGDKVAIALPNCPEFTIGFLAVAALGAVVVPLSTHYRETEIARSLRDFEVGAILTDASLHALYRRLAPHEEIPIVVVGEGGSERGGTPFATLLEGRAATGRLSKPSPDDPVMFQLSSGSTGPSKRILRTQRNLVCESENLVRTVRMQADDRILTVVPLFHTYGLGNCLLGPLRSGAAAILQEKFQRRGTAQALSEHAVTIFPAVPFMLGILADTKPAGPLDLSPLRLCMSAGAPLAADTYRAFQERYGVPIRQQYGTTETGVIAINLEPEIDAHAESVGRPVDGVSIGVVDEEGNDRRSEGEGEVVVRSGAMTTAYFANETLTRERFREGFFRTGDLGRIDAEGRLTVIGRKKIFINTATHKVDPAEVEELIASHPKVESVVVVGVPGPYADEQVKAVIVGRDACQEQEILSFCRGQIADYKIPRVVEFRSELPRNPMGKLLKKYLQEPD